MACIRYISVFTVHLSVRLITNINLSTATFSFCSIFMKLHLHTLDPRPLVDALSLGNHLRKQVYIRFSESLIAIILVDESVGNHPQLWAKVQTRSVFDHICIQCVRDAIAVEINADSFLLALHNYERSNSQGLTIRLQKNTLGGAIATSSNGRNANLCLSYCKQDSEIVHSFRIPVKILRSSHQALLLQEPLLSHIQFMILVPSTFTHMFRRLDRFKEPFVGNTITLRAFSDLNDGGNGSLRLLFEREGQFSVTLSWNESLQFLKPVQTETTSSHPSSHPPSQSGEGSLGYSLHKADMAFESVSSNDSSGITLRMADWKAASKIVSTCKRVVLLVSHGACVLHCLVDGSDSVEVIYYIQGVDP